MERKSPRAPVASVELDLNDRCRLLLLVDLLFLGAELKFLLAEPRVIVRSLRQVQREHVGVAAPGAMAAASEPVRYEEQRTPVRRRRR